MPELAEVETLRLSLVPHLVGARVVGARLLRGDVCRWVDEAGVGRGVMDRPTVRGRVLRAGLLEGGLIIKLLRHGKQMAVVAEDGRVVVVQLGMTGGMGVGMGVGRGAERGGGHVHARWRLEGGKTGEVYFYDPRRFGGLTLVPSEEVLFARVWSRLGPDALAVDGEKLAANAGRSGRAVKAALLDQGVVAGVGNIYADEALFGAGIEPKREARSLSAAEWDRLAAGIRMVLGAAIARGGSTIKDYVDAEGRIGRAIHQVYGRGGEACLVCGSVLEKGLVAQRTTVWCAGCQFGRGGNRG